MSLLLFVIREGRACFKVMCWTDDLKFTLHIFFIFMLVVRTPGRDKVKTSRLISDKLLPLVRPVEPLRLSLRVCSMQRSGDISDWNVLVLRMTNCPFLILHELLDLMQTFLVGIGKGIFYNYCGQSQQNTVTCLRECKYMLQWPERSGSYEVNPPFQYIESKVCSNVKKRNHYRCSSILNAIPNNLQSVVITLTVSSPIYTWCNTIFQEHIILCENILEVGFIVYYDLLENNLF